MGIKTETITTVTCDVCKKSLKSVPEQHHRVAQRHFKDICSSFIHVKIDFTEPMTFDNGGGIVCATCQIKALDEVMKKLVV